MLTFIHNLFPSKKSNKVNYLLQICNDYSGDWLDADLTTQW